MGQKKLHLLHVFGYDFFQLAGVLAVEIPQRNGPHLFGQAYSEAMKDVIGGDMRKGVGYADADLLDHYRRHPAADQVIDKRLIHLGQRF